MSASIGSINQLVVVIRSELSGRVPAARGTRSESKRGAASGRYADHNLGALIAVRVRQIAADDPQRGRKAFRVFLEAVLLSEFGEHMLNDSNFHQLLDEVHLAMDADPACGPLIGSAIEHLLADKP